MEDLTPELERRIQVEELWGRRVVLEETMNAARFREYQSRRLLSLLSSEDGERSTIVKSPLPRRTKELQPASASALFAGRRAAVIVALALFSWFAGQHAYAKFFTPTFLPVAHKTGPSSEVGSRAEARLPKLDEDFRKRSASKLRPLDADLKRIFGSSL